MFFGFGLDAIEVVDGSFGAIRLDSFTLTMHLVIFPIDLIPTAILNQDAKALFFILKELPLINGDQGLLPAEPVLPILFPIAHILVPRGLVLVDSITVSGVRRPLAVVNRTGFVFAHADQVAGAFAVKTHILGCVFEDSALEFQVFEVVHCYWKVF